MHSIKLQLKYNLNSAATWRPDKCKGSVNEERIS